MHLHYPKSLTEKKRKWKYSIQKLDKRKRKLLVSKVFIILMVYGGGGVVSDNDGGDDWLSESTDPMLDLLPDSYSDSNIFLCKS